MLNIQYSAKGTAYVIASELHKELEIKTKLSIWFPRMIEYGFTENKDFARRTKNVPRTEIHFNTVFDWAVTIEMAKHIAMIQRTPKGKEIRDYLLNLDKKVENGTLLSREQMSALFEICKVMGFMSVQKFFETEHYNLFNNPHEWWDYRAKLFGQSVVDLKTTLKSIGKKYYSQRQALIHIDKYELIRMAVCDLFICMGKTEVYALNVAEFAKLVASQVKPDMYNDVNISIDYKSENQKRTIDDIMMFKGPSLMLSNFKTIN